VRASRRFVLAGAGVSVLEIGLSVSLAGTVLGPYFAACAVLTTAVSVAGARLLAPRGPDGFGSRGGPSGGPGGQGGGPGGPPRPPDPWSAVSARGGVPDAQDDVRVAVRG
jgi:hypothetical protein